MARSDSSLTFPQPKHLVLIGPPGAGKGTQSQFLITEYGYKHVSTGELLRKEIASKSDIGLKVEHLMAQGAFVPDDLTIEVLQRNLDFDQNKYIFDGFPRTKVQANYFDEKLMKNQSYLAVLFKVDMAELYSRLVNRRVSADGKYIYNLLTTPPKREGVCDVTGLPLVQRDDDMAEVVTNRLRIYDEQTKPVVEFFAKLKKLEIIDGDQSIDKVKQQIVAILK